MPSKAEFILVATETCCDQMGSRQSPGYRDRQIGEELARLRRAAGKTQQDVAEQIGVSWQQISKYERGEDCISASRRDEIVDYLKPMRGGLAETATAYRPPPGSLNEELERAAHDLSSIAVRIRALKKS